MFFANTCNTTWLILAVVVIIGILFFYLFNRLYVLNRIKSLCLQIDTIRKEGNLSARTKIACSYKEIQELSKKINEGLDAIEKLHKKTLEEENKWKSLFDNSADGVYFVSKEGILQNVNKSFCQMFGYVKEELLGESILKLYQNPRDRVKFIETIEQHGLVQNYEIAFVCKNGEKKTTQITTSIGTSNNYQGIIRDITQRKKDEEEIIRLAFTDQLTGLPNRRSFLQAIGRTFVSSKRRNRQFGVLMIDLNNFKEINDNFGHKEGDKTLQEVAEVFQRLKRQEELASRLGGDEFAILLAEISGQAECELVKQRIQDGLSKINKGIYIISASIGIAIYPENGKTIDELMGFADGLMYQEKKA